MAVKKKKKVSEEGVLTSAEQLSSFLKTHKEDQTGPEIPCE